MLAVFVTKSSVGVRLPATQKAINRLVWWKGKFALFQMPQLEGRADVYPMADTSQCNQWGKSFYRQKEGDTCRNRTVSSNSHLLVGHLDCFRYSSSLVPGLICFHFFAVSSQNCGSSFPGCSLVIV